MIITTIQDANLIACGCCPWPECEGPQKQCESITRSATASQTDYDLALEAWERDRDAWVAEDPENREPGDYTVPEPEPPELDDGETVGSWGPFAEPVGLPTDDLPLIYRKLKSREEIYTGSWGDWELNSETTDLGFYLPDDSYCADGWIGRNGLYDVNLTTATDGDLSSTQESISSNWHEPCGGGATLVFLETITNSSPSATNAVTWTGATPPADFATATTLNLYDEYYEASYGTPPPSPSLPIPGDQSYSYDAFAIEATKSIGAFKTLSDEIDKAQLAANAAAKMPEEWPSPPEGGDCISATEMDWPLIQDIYTGDPAEWPDLYDPLPAATDATASLTKSRYRITIPESWIAPYDEWIDGGSIGPEPPVRSTYEVEWDEVFFPDGWDRTIDDPDVEPPDPLPPGWEHPQIPDPDRPNPSLVAERSWIWDGTKTEEGRWSPWYEIAPPETPGQVRVVNMMVICWKSTRTGVKPTAHGEIYEFPEP